MQCFVASDVRRRNIFDRFKDALVLAYTAKSYSKTTVKRAISDQNVRTIGFNSNTIIPVRHGPASKLDVI
jgi:hypothetical protein